MVLSLSNGQISFHRSTNNFNCSSDAHRTHQRGSTYFIINRLQLYKIGNVALEPFRDRIVFKFQGKLYVFCQACNARNRITLPAQFGENGTFRGKGYAIPNSVGTRSLLIKPIPDRRRLVRTPITIFSLYLLLSNLTLYLFEKLTIINIKKKKC